MHDERDDAALTAYALGELPPDERAAVEALLARSEDARRELAEIRATTAALQKALAADASHTLTPAQRSRIESEAARVPMSVAPPRRGFPWLGVGLAAAASLLVAMVSIPSLLRARIAVPAQPEPTVGYPASTPQTTLSASERERLRSLGYIDTPQAPGYVATPAPLATMMPPPMTVMAMPYPRAEGYMNPPATVAPPTGYRQEPRGMEARPPVPPPSQEIQPRTRTAEGNTEDYGYIRDNPFVIVAQDPRSTFSVDVDTASYSIVRRFLSMGRMPPKDAVRIEELVNYFTYAYEPPRDGRPFAVHVETAECPWKPGHQLVRIALKGREIPRAERPDSNLVFLIDVSGSMSPPNKLPLVQESLKLLVEQLNPRDRVAIVVYAGGQGLALPSTPATRKGEILRAIDSLRAGGSTHGSAGIQLAYQTATESFVRGGVNRVILATDGDFNVGVTSPGELIRLIQEQAKTGVFLTTLGFGMGNFKDQTLEKLADNGNGSYAYIDSLWEARKVLVDQVGGTLVTIAKDVKLQLEWNPARVQAFRLIGYENRVLQHQEFNDDKKDAGEIGAGHAVTALYEVVPPGVAIDVPGTDPLKYQRPAPAAEGSGSREWLTVKLRYKQPDGDRSTLMEVPVEGNPREFAAASADFRFAAALASFGMNLRDSPYKGDAGFSEVQDWARTSLGRDEGLRAEFLTLVARARALAGRR